MALSADWTAFIAGAVFGLIIYRLGILSWKVHRLEAAERERARRNS